MTQIFTYFLHFGVKPVLSIHVCNDKSMNQREIECGQARDGRVNINILGVSELMGEWGMGEWWEFNG